MEYYRLAKQIVLEDIRTVGVTRTIILYLTTTATIGLWFAVILLYLIHAPSRKVRGFFCV